jgi:uncharacterized protein with von Willebrand factor type A (vWA) domain
VALRPTIDRLDFTAARAADLEEMRRALYPLSRRLATRLARERHARRRGPLDFRRTVRASLSTGGVPLVTHLRPRRPHRTELVVLCDVSGSVASFARFTLLLVFALQDQFSRREGHRWRAVRSTATSLPSTSCAATGASQAGSASPRRRTSITAPPVVRTRTTLCAIPRRSLRYRSTSPGRTSRVLTGATISASPS